MIAGSPGGLETAAGDLKRVGTDLQDAADTIGAHGNQVTAVWTGSAADAAQEAFADLRDTVEIGVEVCTGAHGVLVDHAVELRAAQEQYEAGESAAAAGSVARQAAVGAGQLTQAADDQVRAGQAQMTAAVARAERANADAAAAIDRLTERLRDMPAARGPRDIGQELKDLAGGAGETAWAAGPEVLGWIYDTVPLAPYQALSDAIDDTHDWLEDSWGADTGSDQYVVAQGGTELATAVFGLGKIRKVVEEGEDALAGAGGAVRREDGTGDPGAAAADDGADDVAAADDVIDPRRAGAGELADDIAYGHAYQDHVVDGQEFIGINSEEDFAVLIREVIENGAVKDLRDGRTGYWLDGVLVIRDPGNFDGGTAYVHKRGLQGWFDLR